MKLTSRGLLCICTSALLLLRSWPAGFLAGLRGEPLWRLFMPPEPAGGPVLPPMESPELWPMLYHLKQVWKQNLVVVSISQLYSITVPQISNSIAPYHRTPYSITVPQDTGPLHSTTRHSRSPVKVFCSSRQHRRSSRQQTRGPLAC